MSNQIVISSGAKLRNLNGVITGTTGVLDSVPLGGANGVATLDSSGKVPVSQLPSSVVTYLGTWNAATNTPTLANGTGDAGDMYLCNVAGTVNFGAGPITFAVGDWVLYGSGTWQKSNGQNGTVTSVAVTESGDALTITGSPITTAGTINIGFAGTSAQYVAGNGSLITFPALTGYVPYTGATSDVDLDTFKLNASSLGIKGTAGAGHLGLKHQSATATASASESSLFANVNGDLAWKNDNLHLTTFATYANTADRVYTFPNASGTVALTSDLSSYVPYNGATMAVDITGNNFSSSNIQINGDNTSNFGYLGFKQFSGGSSGFSGYTSIFAQGTNSINIGFSSTGANKTISFSSSLISSNTTRSYSFPDASGTVALTSDIPSLSGYVPYTGATSNVNLGNYTLTTTNTVFTPVLFSTYLYGGTTLVASPMTISTSDLIFQTGPTGGSYWSQKMILTEAGNLGIGTTSPLYKTVIQTANNTDGLVVTTNANDTETGLYIRPDHTNGIVKLFATGGTNKAFGFYNGNTLALNIATSGAATFSSSVTAANFSSSPLSVAPYLDLTYNATAGLKLTYDAAYAISYIDNYYHNTVGSQPYGDIRFRNKINGVNTLVETLTIKGFTGNVGIGTTSPSTKLAIEASSSSSADVTYLSLINTNGENVGNIDFNNTFGNLVRITGTKMGGGALADDGMLTISTASNSVLSEKMRLTNVGNLLVGTTTTTGLEKSVTVNGASNSGYIMQAGSSNQGYLYVSGGYVFLESVSNSIYVMPQGANGVYISPGSTSWTANSDERLKNINGNIENAVERLMTLRPVNFSWKSDNTNKDNIGLIAQDVEKVFPQVIDKNKLPTKAGEKQTDETEYLGVRYQELVPVLVKAIQELKAEIDELKNK